MNTLINGDSLQYLKTMQPVACIIADIPDNLGLKYDGFVDSRPDYYAWVSELISISVDKCSHFWLSFYNKHDLEISSIANEIVKKHNLSWAKYLWVYTFSQYTESDCAQSYRTILRISKPDARLNTSGIRVASDRQKMGDPRANPDGRVPNNLWSFPRVVGNSHERRPWHLNQHPVGIYNRILRLSTAPQDTVVDPFLGTGTLFRANNQYKVEDRRNAVGIEISKTYCQEIANEHNLEIT